MPKYSKSSRQKLETCHTDIQIVFEEVIKHWDCTVLCGHRSKKEQNEAFSKGRSKLKFPESKHNGTPSEAIDVAPYPIDWNDHKRFYFFAGFVLGIAKSKGIKLRWGGDWDSDKDVSDQSFNDLPHFELDNR